MKVVVFCVVLVDGANAIDMSQILIDSDLLIELYVNQHYSLRSLAAYFNCNRSVIKDRLQALNIEIRPFNDKKYYINKTNHNKGKCCNDASGYIIQSSQRQHRIIMEDYLKRPLTSEEYVHHIDFDKTNNDIENLFLFSSDEVHMSYHGYLMKHKYIHPQKFVEEIYPQISKYKSYDYLYLQYVSLGKSVAQIVREINGLVSRTTITKILKKHNLFNEKKHINQYV